MVSGGLIFDVLGEHAFATVGVCDRDATEDPRGTVARHVGRGTNEAVLSDEVRQVHADFGIEPPFGRQLRHRTGHVEGPEWIRDLIRVAPEPAELPLINRVDDAVGAEDLRIEQRMLDRHVLPQQHAVAIDASARHAIQPLRDVDPLDLERRFSTRRDIDRFAAIAEPVFRELISVTSHVEESLLPEETRLVDRCETVAVGEKDDVVRRLQLDERHAAAGIFINDLEREGLFGAEGRNIQRECDTAYNELRESHGHPS